MASTSTSVKLPTGKNITDLEVINGYWVPKWLSLDKDNTSVTALANVRYIMEYIREHHVKIDSHPVNLLELATRTLMRPAIIIGFDVELNISLLFNVEKIKRGYPALWEKITHSCADHGVLDEAMLKKVQAELGLSAWIDNDQVKQICRQLLSQDGLSQTETAALTDLYWRDEQTFKRFSLTYLDKQALWIKAGKAEISTDISSPRVRERYLCVTDYLKEKARADNLRVIQATAELWEARA
jgi:hypothetical protein